jgi:hypothetical protein
VGRKMYLKNVVECKNVPWKFTTIFYSN